MSQNQCHQSSKYLEIIEVITICYISFQKINYLCLPKKKFCFKQSDGNITENLSSNNITFIFQECNKMARLIILHLFSLLKSNNGFTSSFNKPQKNLAMINLIFCTIVFAINDATERLQKYYLQMCESNKNLINFLKHFILFCFF